MVRFVVVAEGADVVVWMEGSSDVRTDGREDESFGAATASSSSTSLLSLVIRESEDSDRRDGDGDDDA